MMSNFLQLKIGVFGKKYAKIAMKNNIQKEKNYLKARIRVTNPKIRIYNLKIRIKTYNLKKK